MNWWQRLFRRGTAESQLETELRFHLDQHIAQLIAQGLGPEEARRRARLALGGPEQVKEQCRDARGTRWLEDFLQDVNHAVRTLSKQPGFAAVALLTLALGIGVTTVMFTLVNGVLLKPLPYPQPNQLVSLQEQTERSNEYGNRWAFAYLNFLDCKRESHSLASMAAWRFNVGTVSDQGQAEYVSARQISSEFFSVLKTSPPQGRDFLPEDDRLGAEPVVILGYSFWQRLRGRSPVAIGTSLRFNEKSYTVVGIAPAGFRLDGEEPDVFTPLGQDPSPNLQNRGRHPGIQVLARLRPGVNLAEAQTELTLIGRHLAGQYPDTNAGRSFVADPLRWDVGDARSTLWLLLGAVTLVLLIACANVASLLLARAVSRERELAMRVALGASRGRLIRQCLTESGVLALAGGLLGVFLASSGIRPFVAFWPGTLPRAEEVQLDWRVLSFAVGISLLSGLLFGLAPALRAPFRDIDQIIRGGARTIAGSSRRLHASFVSSEIALAVVLLVAAGMLGRTLLRLSSLNPGVNVHNVLVTRTALSPAVLADPAQIRAAWDDVLGRARRVPGVQAATAVDTFPMREGNNQLGYWPTPALPHADQQPLALATSVTPDYLKVMGIPLLKGRFFDDHDRLGSEPVIVVDEVLAQQAFGGQEPVGRQLWIPSMGSNSWSDSDHPVPIRVVGVVGHVRHWGLASDDQARVRAQFYYPFAQVPDPFLHRWSDLMSISVRTSIPPLNVLGELRKAVRGATGGVAGDQAIYEARTLEQLASDSLSRQRFLLLLFGVFAALALLLACIGVYGVLAYLTGRRVPEIGLRMALGATASEVMQLVLRQSFTMILVGAGVGLLAALAAGRLLRSLVDGIQSNEPFTIALMLFVLFAAAQLASFLPARRASRVDPIAALRQD
jgi:predicted permease